MREKIARIIPEYKEETASEQNVDDMNCRLSKYLIACVILRKIQRVCLCVCVWRGVCVWYFMRRILV